MVVTIQDPARLPSSGSDTSASSWANSSQSPMSFDGERPSEKLGAPKTEHNRPSQSVLHKGSGPPREPPSSSGFIDSKLAQTPSRETAVSRDEKHAPIKVRPQQGPDATAHGSSPPQPATPQNPFRRKPAPNTSGTAQLKVDERDGDSWPLKVARDANSSATVISTDAMELSNRALHLSHTKSNDAEVAPNGHTPNGSYSEDLLQLQTHHVPDPAVPPGIPRSQPQESIPSDSHRRAQSQEQQEIEHTDPARATQGGREETERKADKSPAQNIRSISSRKSNETYQIRQVNWYDASSQQNPRRSPVMVQNANGPCPLLALVNALLLSTPSHISTPLVETLRTREQISLGLLLDAVIDELMSDRRGTSIQELPDVSELYAFLVTLHTGMNVNPRFVPLEEGNFSLLDDDIKQPSTTQDFRRAGGFEETREMKLYSTFGIPLIHGWIPHRNHPAVAALKRCAATYEDAQNIMFAEEELRSKLDAGGLEPDEQTLLEDIGRVKYFLSSTATQLTGYGLDTITDVLTAGSVSILFRNDHFSTLYKHPNSGQLMVLVTDMGYAGHDEVVWESLVDVNGEGSEFYAGDFRPVGNVHDNSVDPNNRDGWELVTRKPRRTTASSSTAQPQSKASPSDAALGKFGNLSLDQGALLQHQSHDHAVPSPSTEQEDHDLALAMQLQEEEEERSRREAAARRHENQLSQAYVDNSDSQTGRRTFPGFGRGAANSPRSRGSRSSSGGGPHIPPRGRGGSSYNIPVTRHTSNTLPVTRHTTTSTSTSQPSTPVHTQTHRPADNDSEDAPPPSYEQAAKGPAYHPPLNHPSHPNSSLRPRAASIQSAYALQQQQQQQGANASGGRRLVSSHAASRGFFQQHHDNNGAGQGIAAGGDKKERSGGEKERDCVVM